MWIFRHFASADLQSYVSVVNIMSYGHGLAHLVMAILSSQQCHTTKSIECHINEKKVCQFALFNPPLNWYLHTGCISHGPWLAHLVTDTLSSQHCHTVEAIEFHVKEKKVCQIAMFSPSLKCYLLTGFISYGSWLAHLVRTTLST